MTIELYFSNRLEDLAEKLSDLMDRENREKENILEGSLTIVPNQNLAKWLQLTLARQRSVLMNVDFQYLDAGLWNLIGGLDEREEKPVMMDHPFRRMLLLHALQTLERQEKAYEPLRRYLLGPDGRPGPDYGIKLWQLTERMVHLFEEYEFHRSDMIRSWLNGPAPLNGMEHCQQKLYLRLRELRDGYSRNSRQRILSLEEYAGEILPLSPAPATDPATEDPSPEIYSYLRSVPGICFSSKHHRKTAAGIPRSLCTSSIRPGSSGKISRRLEKEGGYGERK